MQIFGALSRDLGISVLSESSCSLDRQISMLPEEHHNLAIHASFPNVLRHKLLELDCSFCSTASAQAALDTFATVPKSRGLVLQNVHLTTLTPLIPRQHSFKDTLIRSVSSVVEAVTIAGVTTSAQSLSMLLKGMSQNTSLSSLSLSSMHAVSGDETALEDALAAGLCVLQGLRTLQLTHLPFVSDGVGPVSEALKALTALTRLQVAACARNAGTIASYLTALPLLQDLDLRFHVRTASESTSLSNAISGLTLLTKLTLSGLTIPIKLKSFSHFFVEGLWRLSKLRCLDMRGSCMSTSGIRLLTEAVKGMTCLRALMLDVFVINSDTVALWDSLTKTAKCTELSLRSEFHISPYTDRSLPVCSCEKLAKLPDLQRVHMPRYMLSVPSRIALTPTLRALAGVTHLALEDHPRSLANAPDFLSCIGTLSRLVRLEIGGCELNVEEGYCLANGLSQLPELKELHLFRLNISPTSAETIASSIATLRGLSFLDLSDAFSGSAGLKIACRAMQALTALKHLNVARGGSRYERIALAECAEPLATALPSLLKLKTLSLSGWYLCSSSLEGLAPAIAQLRLLESLDLSNCGIKDDSLSSLATSLQPLSSLRTMLLCLNEITAVGVMHLTTGLCQASSIRKLSLLCNPLTDKGAKAVADLLKSSPIRELDIRHTGMSARGVSLVSGAVSLDDPVRRLHLTSEGESAQFFRGRRGWLLQI